MNFPKAPQNKKFVYLDHAATTYLDPKVKEAMEPYWDKIFGNPSGLYELGREAHKALTNARATIANILHCAPSEIIFTSGGTESINTAIFGVAYAHKEHGKHIISTPFEHHAVLHSLEKLKKESFEITFVQVDRQGFVKPEDVAAAVRPDTILITIMYANNEVGTVLPIADIGRSILKWRQKQNTPYPYFHTDACQASGALDVDVEKLHVDLMTVNGSKIYGPKGAGFLYKRRTVKLQPLLFGGGQEMRMRAGTENVPGIVGLACAFEAAQNTKNEEGERLACLRNYLWQRISTEIPKVILNGPALEHKGKDHDWKRLPNNLHITILDIEGEALLLYLDEYGIVASTGSACTSESLDPSHVLLAMGLPYEYAHGSLRFTFGKRNTRENVDYVMKYLPAIVKKLREISPLNLSLDPAQNVHAQIWQR
jgi:cysteine desulfurase